MNHIEIRGLTKVIRGTKVLDDISIVVPHGGALGLVGPNGSGKTMLMRAIVGLIRPSSGSVVIDGEELGAEVDAPLRVGIMIEGPAFIDSYSGLKNLQLLASVQRSISDDECAHAMERLGLDPRDTRVFRSYSLGMKQRLGLAAAIMEHPDLIVLDEPTNALDEGGVQLFMEIMAQERARGATFVVSCHDAPLLRSVVDEIAYLTEGRLVRMELLHEGDFDEGD